MTKRWSLERGREEFVRLAHEGLEAPALFARAAQLLERVVPFDGACWHTLDPGTNLITSHVTNLDGSGFPFICRNEYTQEDVAKFSALARAESPVGILSEETRGQPRSSPRFEEIYGPRGWSAEMRAALRVGGSSWGAVMLLRAAGRPDFTPEEGRFVASISKHLAHGIRTAMLASGLDDESDPETPGLVLFGSDGEVETMTPAGAHWLEELAASDRGSPGLPSVVQAVAMRARGPGSADDAAGIARTRVRAASGRWLVLHGSKLQADRDGRIAVVIEVAKPSEIAPVISSAYGLSERERAVVQRVIQGLSTRQIAESLFLSPYTVQDHLKTVFEKVGVRSRRELVASVFYGHVKPRVDAGVEIGADGWFNA